MHARRTVESLTRVGATDGLEDFKLLTVVSL